MMHSAFGSSDGDPVGYLRVRLIESGGWVEAEANGGIGGTAEGGLVCGWECEDCIVERELAQVQVWHEGTWSSRMSWISTLLVVVYYVDYAVAVI